MNHKVPQVHEVKPGVWKNLVTFVSFVVQDFSEGVR